MNSNHSVYYQKPNNEADFIQFNFQGIEQIYFIPSLNKSGHVRLISGSIELDDSERGYKYIRKLAKFKNNSQQQIQIVNTRIVNTQIAQGGGDVQMTQITGNNRKYSLYSTGENTLV